MKQSPLNFSVNSCAKLELFVNKQKKQMQADTYSFSKRTLYNSSM